jgi:hypothetical protein
MYLKSATQTDCTTNMEKKKINMLGLSSGVHFAHAACYWKFFLLHNTQVLCQYRLYRVDSAYLTDLVKVKVRVRVTLRLAVYRLSARPGVRPVDTHDQGLFLQPSPCGDSPYVTSSLTRRWVWLLLICLAFRQVYISHMQHVIENSYFCTIYKSSVSKGFAEQIMSILLILSYNGSLFNWMVVSLTTAKFKPRIFFVSGFTLSYTTNMFTWFCMTCVCHLHNFVI